MMRFSGYGVVFPRLRAIHIGGKSVFKWIWYDSRLKIPNNQTQAPNKVSKRHEFTIPVMTEWTCVEVLCRAAVYGFVTAKILVYTKAFNTQHVACCMTIAYIGASGNRADMLLTSVLEYALLRAWSMLARTYLKKYIRRRRWRGEEVK